MSLAEILALLAQVVLIAIREAMADSKAGREKDAAYKIARERFEEIAAAALKRALDQARRESKTAQAMEKRVEREGDPDAWKKVPPGVRNKP